MRRGQRAFRPDIEDEHTWTLLPEYLRDPAVSRDSFRKQLKTLLFAVLRQCAIQIHITLHHLLLSSYLVNY